MGDSEDFVQHCAVGHDGQITPRPDDPCFANRKTLFRQRIGFEMVIKIFVFAVDHRVVDCHRIDQHCVSVLHRRRRHDHDSGIMRVKPFHALTVKRSAPFRSARRQTHGDGHRHVGAEIMRARVVQNLIYRDHREIGELHFHDRPHSL